MPTEKAKLATKKYLDGVRRIRRAVREPDLLSEEWSSLTKHVAEAFITSKFKYLKCESSDSVVDAIVRQGPQTSISFDPTNTTFLHTRGVQIKGVRHVPGKGYGKTSELKSFSFKWLWIVWLNEDYSVKKIYRVTRAAAQALIAPRLAANPAGKNVRKITHVEADRIGLRIRLQDGEDL